MEEFLILITRRCVQDNNVGNNNNQGNNNKLLA